MVYVHLKSVDRFLMKHWHSISRSGTKRRNSPTPSHIAEAAQKVAKTDRRTAKSAFTRCGKSLAKLSESKRPEQEVREGLNKLQLVFDNIVAKHESYYRLIEVNEEYEHEEIWIESCHE